MRLAGGECNIKNAERRRGGERFLISSRRATAASDCRSRLAVRDPSVYGRARSCALGGPGRTSMLLRVDGSPRHHSQAPTVMHVGDRNEETRPANEMKMRARWKLWCLARVPVSVLREARKLYPLENCSFPPFFEPRSIYKRMFNPLFMIL